MEDFIKIKTEGTIGEVVVQTGLYQQKNVLFKVQCDNLMFAELVAKQLSEKLDNTLQNIRKQEYDRGWRHAKNHHKKATWFAYFFGTYFDYGKD